MKFDVEAFKRHVSESFKEVAIWSAGEIQKAYKTAVQAFYDDYTPKQYRRTKSTFKASSGYNKSGEELVTQVGECAFEAGIKVDPGLIPGQPYYHTVDGERVPQDTAFIFSNTFDKGLHGFQSMSVRKKKYNSPWKYKLMRYVGGRNRGDPPKAKVDREYRAIGRQLQTRINSALKGLSLY